VKIRPLLRCLPVLASLLTTSCRGAEDGSATLASQPQAASSCALPARATPKETTLPPTSVEGAALGTCSTQPLTGVYRDGRCATGPDDLGVHVVCAQVTDAFLGFSKGRGNDLVTPRGEFPGLHAGDRWCLCAARWAEAEAAGVAPPVALDATEAAAARTIPRATLEAHALPPGSGTSAK
jgi:uncharacterized protein (DUF2237 family)